jgi:hypothetical protein
VAEDITTKEIGYQLNGMDDRGEGGKFYGNLILYKDGFARFYVATNKTAYYGYWLLEDEEIVLYQKYIVHPMMTTEFVYSTSIVADGGKLAGSATMSLGSYGGGAVPVESDGTIRYTTDAEFDTYVEGLKG